MINPLVRMDRIRQRINASRLLSVDYSQGTINGISKYGSGLGTHTAQLGYRTAKLNQGVMVSGKVDTDVSGDKITAPRGTQIVGDWYQNINKYQGTIRILFKPNWDYNDGLSHGIFQNYSTDWVLGVSKSATNTINVIIGNVNIWNATATAFTKGTWVDLVIMWDTKNTLHGGTKYFEIYANDSLIGSSGTAPTISPTIAVTSSIGYISNSNSLNGVIDEFAISTRPITTTEITALYNSGNFASFDTIAYPECLAFLWKADGSGAVSGTGAACTGGTLWTNNLLTNGHMQALTDGAVTGSELQTNGDMETGDPPTGYGVIAGCVTVASSATSPHSGSKCLLGTIIGTVNNMVITSPTPTFVIGKRYKVSAYLKNVDVTSGIKIYTATSNRDTALGVSSIVTATSWTEVTVTWIATQANNVIVIAVNGTDGQTFFVDDISVKEIEVLPTGWSKEDTPVIVKASTANTLFDLGSIQVDVDGTAHGFSQQKTGLTAGNNYVASLWLKSDGTNTAQLRIYDDINAADIVTVPITANTWTRVETCFKLPASCTSITVFVESGSAATYTFYATHLCISPNLVDNGGMEGTYTDGLANGYVNNRTTPTESSTAHTGSKAQQITNCVYDEFIYSNSFTTVSGTWYYSSAWINKTSGSGITGYFLSQHLNYAGTSATFPAGSVYIKKSVLTKAIGTTGRIYFENRTNGDISIFDDISVVTLGSVTLTVTPATLANSFEPGSGLRMDGDTLTYPTANNFSVQRGTIYIKFTPFFHYAPEENKRIFEIYTSSSDYLSINYLSVGAQIFQVARNGSVACQESISWTSNAQIQKEHKLVFTWDTGTKLCSLYIDGVLTAVTGATPFDIFTLTSTMSIFYSPNVAYRTGDSWVKKFEIYNRSLTATEIRSLK